MIPVVVTVESMIIITAFTMAPRFIDLAPCAAYKDISATDRASLMMRRDDGVAALPHT